MDSDDSEAQPAGEIFDEAWYLNEYPGVAEIIRAGGFRSGRDHYIAHGRREGRHPTSLTKMAQAIADGTMRRPDQPITPPFWDHNGTGFLTPNDLMVSEAEPAGIAVISSHTMATEWLRDCLSPHCRVVAVSVDPLCGPPELTSAELAACDFAVIQLSLREVVENDLSRHAPYADLASHVRAFDRACQILEAQLTAMMRWNRDHGTMTFVTNFFVPQESAMGRMYPRFDIRNPTYFVSELNRHLEACVLRHANAFVLSLDRLAMSLGQRYVQDDSVFPFEYGAMLPFTTDVGGWVGPLPSFPDHYDVRTRTLLPDVVWAELLAMYRTVRKVDRVNLVAIELVDTLWRGRGAPGAGTAEPATGGWPAGVADALVQLRKRGIQLAIISKNDEGLVREIWPKIFADGLRLEDFSAIQINWRAKSENMRAVLQELNVPPRAVLFIDADSAERDAMRQEFPEIRTTGNDPLYLRRILLWSPELQGAPVQDELSKQINSLQTPPDTDRPAVTPAWPIAAAPEVSAFETPRLRLEALWSRALNNAITPDEAEEIRRLSVGIAMADRGARRVRPFSDTIRR